MEGLTPNQERLLSALKKADRADRTITIEDGNGTKVEAYTYNKYGYNPQTKSYGKVVKVVYTYLNTKHLYGQTSVLDYFLQRFADWQVVKEAEIQSSISIENMAKVIVSEFDSKDYLPDECDEDEYGRPYNSGSKSSEVEIEEDDFYALFEVDITSHMWYSPATYWEPEDSGNELTSLSLYLTEAYRIDEDGEEHPITEDEFKRLETMLKEELEVA